MSREMADTDLERELASIDPIQFDIRVADIEGKAFDVLISGELPLLKAFDAVYDNVIFIAKSKLGIPLVVAPDFPNREHAEVWKQYWERALSNPAQSCKNCPTVQELFKYVISFREQARSEQESKDIKSNNE